jgi:ornithine--oxo-acid transaminase
MALPNKISETVGNGALASIRESGMAPILDSMSHEECLEMTLRYGTHNYHPIDVTIVEGNGAWVKDDRGNVYIDCVGCYSALAFGHSPEKILNAVRAQTEKLHLTGRAVYTRELALFLKVLCEFSGTDMACPMNTGTEAVETAIKIARRWAYSVKGVPEDKAEIIVAAENFHGRTTTIVSFSSEAGYKAGFGPFAPGFVMVPFGDIEAVKAAITPNTAAVMMEPIQAEGGILIPPDGFMADLRALCTANNVLLVWDEIQTGFCRTGYRFAWQSEDAEPDLMCLGKALGGGVMPVSAVVGKRSVMEVLTPGSHGSTFGGNPLACAAAIASMVEFDSGQYEPRVTALGQMLHDKLHALNHPVVKEIRGRGLLVGVEIVAGYDDETTDAFLRNGILTKETRHRTFRFAPPLTCDEKLISEIATRIHKALDEVHCPA